MPLMARQQRLALLFTGADQLRVGSWQRVVQQIGGKTQAIVRRAEARHLAEGGDKG